MAFTARFSKDGEYQWQNGKPSPQGAGGDEANHPVLKTPRYPERIQNFNVVLTSDLKCMMKTEDAYFPLV